MQRSQSASSSIDLPPSPSSPTGSRTCPSLYYDTSFSPSSEDEVESEDESEDEDDGKGDDNSPIMDVFLGSTTPDSSFLLFPFRPISKPVSSPTFHLPTRHQIKPTFALPSYLPASVAPPTKTISVQTSAQEIIEAIVEEVSIVEEAEPLAFETSLSLQGWSASCGASVASHTTELEVEQDDSREEELNDNAEIAAGTDDYLVETQGPKPNFEVHLERVDLPINVVSEPLLLLLDLNFPKSTEIVLIDPVESRPPTAVSSPSLPPSSSPFPLPFESACFRTSTPPPKNDLDGAEESSSSEREQEEELEDRTGSPLCLSPPSPIDDGFSGSDQEQEPEEEIQEVQSHDYEDAQAGEVESEQEQEAGAPSFAPLPSSPIVSYVGYPWFNFPTLPALPSIPPPPSLVTPASPSPFACSANLLPLPPTLLTSSPSVFAPYVEPFSPAVEDESMSDEDEPMSDDFAAEVSIAEEPWSAPIAEESLWSYNPSTALSLASDANDHCPPHVFSTYDGELGRGGNSSDVWSGGDAFAGPETVVVAMEQVEHAEVVGRSEIDFATKYPRPIRPRRRPRSEDFFRHSPPAAPLATPLTPPSPRLPSVPCASVAPSSSGIYKPLLVPSRPAPSIIPAATPLKSFASRPHLAPFSRLDSSSFATATLFPSLASERQLATPPPLPSITLVSPPLGRRRHHSTTLLPLEDVRLHSVAPLLLRLEL